MVGANQSDSSPPPPNGQLLDQDFNEMMIFVFLNFKTGILKISSPLTTIFEIIFGNDSEQLDSIFLW